MEEVTAKTTETAEKPEKKERKSNPTNTVMIVQTIVCAAAILLVVMAGKLSPQTFDFIKQEYNRMMSVDIGADEIADSAKSAAESVMGKGTDDSYTQDKKRGSANVKKQSLKRIPSAEDGKAVAVMSLFKDDGEITVPVHGEITSEYGNRTNPVSGEYLMHSGVDIAADQGAKVGAAYNGVVSEVGSNSVSGNYICLVHTDGTETLYCHCSKIIAKKGDVVRAGETIALVGSTGRSTGPHLHFEILLDGKSVNPLLYLPVRNGAV